MLLSLALGGYLHPNLALFLLSYIDILNNKRSGFSHPYLSLLVQSSPLGDCTGSRLVFQSSAESVLALPRAVAESTLPSAWRARCIILPTRPPLTDSLQGTASSDFAIITWLLSEWGAASQTTTQVLQGCLKHLNWDFGNLLTDTKPHST